ncbi:MAG: TPM domain-containing protein [Deltaproteobacteria bacterium]|nr:MAG: TPM domain-containing protein [Deltaproteobacteria bacterium]
MRSLAALLAVAFVASARAAEPPVPVPQGYVTDLAHAIGPDVRGRIERLDEELRDKTGAETAVVTVETTAPLNDFTYAMRIADTWKPGRKREDTGVVFLVATRDRKLRILVGYGLEGILPDGLVGEIEDREVVPAFRAGRVDEGVWRGVAALLATAVIATARAVEPPVPCSRGSCYTRRPPDPVASGAAASSPPAPSGASGAASAAAGAASGASGAAASAAAAPAAAGEEETWRGFWSSWRRCSEVAATTRWCRSRSASTPRGRRWRTSSSGATT